MLVGSGASSHLYLAFTTGVNAILSETAKVLILIYPISDEIEIAAVVEATTS